ncbi:MAG TPA: ROK family protein [Thermomicrobiales bacterium]|nr:ROK family protein [Thermomicrobiales bacterium]
MSNADRRFGHTMTQPPASADTILHLLRQLPETTRTDLTTLTGLSKATVSGIVAQFMDNGLVIESGKRQPSRGRSQILLRLQASARQVIGAEFNEHGCRAVLADLRAGPIRFSERSFISVTPEDFVEALRACVTELQASATAPIMGIGIGVPGSVDEDGQSVTVSVPFKWRDVPFADLVREKTGFTTMIANRAKTAVLGEYWQGNPASRSERSHLAYINAGAGIVAGFMFDGDPYFGHTGSAGEIGHTTVEPDGPPCGCGNHGCLHMLASESAIVHHVRELRASTPDRLLLHQPALDIDDDTTFEDLIAALRDGHPLVEQAIERAARYLGIAIANLANTMNPSHVVIGGSLAALGDVFLIPLRAEIQRRALWNTRNHLGIAISRLGDDVGPIGGAALFLTRIDSASIVEDPGYWL